jgi:glycosyltransferase involved in cell wall biosynthesis
MKKISVLVPCYNEKDNILPLSQAIEEELVKSCPKYDYEICFIDNNSTDGTRQLVREICGKNNKIKAILNIRNFGPFNSQFYGLTQLTGDCGIIISADFQDPVELIPEMVKKWESGAKIVATVKESNEENKIINYIRTIYYKLLRKLSDVEIIEQFTGFGLYDREFIEILKKLNDAEPFLRGIVAELGYKIEYVRYKHAKRRSGKSKFSLYKLFDAAMLSFTTYTKVGLRIATISGAIIAFLSMCVAIWYFIYKLLFWNSVPIGIAPLIIGVFFLGSLQLFFVGFLGEYIMNINHRVMNRPLVIEEERINW